MCCVPRRLSWGEKKISTGSFVIGLSGDIREDDFKEEKNPVCIWENSFL
jgi:hypothetical protein